MWSENEMMDQHLGCAVDYRNNGIAGAKVGVNAKTRCSPAAVTPIKIAYLAALLLGTAFIPATNLELQRQAPVPLLAKPYSPFEAPRALLPTCVTYFGCLGEPKDQGRMLQARTTLRIIPEICPLHGL
ncbi:hypothetical protein ASU33_16265 [Solirubrum puertoriconensis]|uniref:Uncharacterized protein n=1 Tax=Solirubrum puertoriconensis TaxID=1751427 RepID=A0A9X0L5Z7_SOLP1|nr:hypothetical protein ASU33_16265 [Solirubrum puertoriconensis]